MGIKRRPFDMSSGSEVDEIIIYGKSEGMSISKDVLKRKTFQRLQCSSEKGEKMDLTKTKQCYNVLKKLMAHHYGWVFNQPVDPVKLNIPDYFDIISKPMDLGTVKQRLESGQYASTHKFEADVRLTFANAMLYNPPGNDVHFMAKQLNNLFSSEWKLLEENWRKKAGMAQHPVKKMKVQTVTSRSIVHTRFLAHSDSVVRKSLTARPAESAQVIRKCAQGSTQASSKDADFVTLSGREGCLPRSSSSTQLHIKTSEVQLGERRCELDGSETCSDPSTAPFASLRGEDNHFPEYEVPLSPSKALRVAMLKTRFAGTIVKAQHEGLLHQGKKIDPAKLQLEKEKLERRQQEEKARIEAQVKAAEAAAQCKAEAEMKTKRQKEREAARLALQTMKKTVDIDNNDLLNDLRVLSKEWKLNAPGELIVDFVEMPPGFGSPLERLGLFIKNDVEEDIEDWLSDTVCCEMEEGEIS